MRIYLIRHAMTLGNLEKRYVGTTDEPILESEKECLEAYAAAAPDCYHMGEKSAGAYVYVSPMTRCRQTAELLFPYACFTAVPELAECDFGSFEYKNYIELNGNLDYQRFIDSGGSTDFPDGESRAHFIKRVKAGFCRILGEHIRKERGDMILVVHGGTIMAILSSYSDSGKEYYDWQLKNGEGCFGTIDVTGNDILIKDTERMKRYA